MKIFLADVDRVISVVCKGVDNGGVEVGREVGGLVFLCVDNGHVHDRRRREGHRNPGGFNGNDLVDALPVVKLCNFPSDFHQKVSVKLVVKKTSHLQNVTRENLAFVQDLFFHSLHGHILPTLTNYDIYYSTFNCFLSTDVSHS